MDRALLTFALTYAKQVEADHSAFNAAIKRGEIEAASP